MNTDCKLEDLELESTPSSNKKQPFISQIRKQKAESVCDLPRVTVGAQAEASHWTPDFQGILHFITCPLFKQHTPLQK